MILFDEFHVVCDPEVFRRAFLGYDFSLPTGTTPGKVWRRSAGDRHYVGQYGFPEGDTVPIFWRQVLFIEEPGAAENYRVSGHLCDQFWKLLDPFNDGIERDCPPKPGEDLCSYCHSPVSPLTKVCCYCEGKGVAVDYIFGGGPMPRKRGKLLKDIPKCKACGCEEVRLVTCRGVEAYLLRCGDHPFHHFSHVFRTADEAIADWRKKNSPVTAA